MKKKKPKRKARRNCSETPKSSRQPFPPKLNVRHAIVVIPTPPYRGPLW